MASIQSKLLIAAMNLTWQKSFLTTGKRLRARIAKDRRKGPFCPPASVYRKAVVHQSTRHGWTVYTIALPDADLGRHVLYLHGGAYVFQIGPLHFGYAMRLCRVLRCPITIPIYPLAPEHTYRDVFPALVEIYRELLGRHDPGKLMVTGDSAGGGMALALLQCLKAEKLPQPRDLVLISPWLDATLADPAAAAMESKDPILALPGLIQAGRMYAGGDDPATPLCSPIHGDLAGLGRVSVFIGTRDLFWPDCRRLHARMTTEIGAAIETFEYPGLFHSWPLCPLPETRAAMNQILQVMQR